MNETFLAFLQKEKENCISREKELIADERNDEAKLCKVEANIYDVFTSLYNVSCKQAGADEKEADKLFMAKAEAVPASWKVSFEKAKEHDDTCKMLIEQTKLDTVKKILDYYHTL